MAGKVYVGEINGNFQGLPKEYTKPNDSKPGLFFLKLDSPGYDVAGKIEDYRGIRPVRFQLNDSCLLDIIDRDLQEAYFGRAVYREGVGTIFAGIWSKAYSTNLRPFVMKRLE